MQATPAPYTFALFGNCPEKDPCFHSRMKTDKELYHELRVLSCERLWNDEVARFDRSTPEERIKRVAVIRAVGTVFSESGTAKQKAEVRSWLVRLLQDPSEKVRRYAMTALPKIGAGPVEEEALLSLLRTTTIEREKKFLGQALDKIGGTATLSVVGGRSWPPSANRAEGKSECSAQGKAQCHSNGQHPLRFHPLTNPFALPQGVGKDCPR